VAFQIQLKCGRVFQLLYAIEACKTDFKEQIFAMVNRGAGVRDITRKQQVATSTVIRALNNLFRKVISGYWSMLMLQPDFSDFEMNLFLRSSDQFCNDQHHQNAYYPAGCAVASDLSELPFVKKGG